MPQRYSFGWVDPGAIFGSPLFDGDVREVFTDEQEFNSLDIEEVHDDE